MGTPSTGALVRLWTLCRPDIVHVATEGPLGWSALQAARRLRLPVTADFRTNFHAYGRHYKLGWLARPIMAYLRKFHNRADATMVPTEALRAQLAAGGFERLVVVSRGVDTRLFHPARRSAALRAAWGAGERTLVLGYVGRLAAEKNLRAVLEAHAALREVLGAVRLVFVGDGPLRTELAQRCPDAFFAGQRRGEDLAAHYASLDAFLFPSLTETFGNVTLEAMASGLAVVAHDTAAAGQFIRHGHNGLLAEGDASAAFVRAALALAAEPDRAAFYGARARASVEPLDWDMVVAHFEAVLAAAVERQRPASTVAWLQSVRRHA
jgi:glycosyltransferase involved in cell wall biosynthesis